MKNLETLNQSQVRIPLGAVDQTKQPYGCLYLYVCYNFVNNSRSNSRWM